MLTARSIASAIPPAKAVAAPRERQRAIAPEALAAMERGAQLAGAPRPKRQTESPTAQRPVPAPVAVTVKKDWSALLSRQRATARPSSRVEVRALKHASSPVPAGFHDSYVLSRLVQSRQPVSGLMISIGVNTVPNEDGAIPEPVRKLLQSLIGPDDFACQSGNDEFLLIFPNERGAAAQRRLSFVAQQLWDFQLRSLGNLSILFSWGGVEVRGESIEEAIASATERMRETKRGRKVVAIQSNAAEAALRPAV